MNRVIGLFLLLTALLLASQPATVDVGQRAQTMKRHESYIYVVTSSRKEVVRVDIETKAKTSIKIEDPNGLLDWQALNVCINSQFGIIVSIQEVAGNNLLGHKLLQIDLNTLTLKKAVSFSGIAFTENCTFGSEGDKLLVTAMLRSIPDGPRIRYGAVLLDQEFRELARFNLLEGSLGTPVYVPNLKRFFVRYSSSINRETSSLAIIPEDFAGQADIMEFIPFPFRSIGAPVLHPDGRTLYISFSDGDPLAVPVSKSGVAIVNAEERQIVDFFNMWLSPSGVKIINNDSAYVFDYWRTAVADLEQKTLLQEYRNPDLSGGNIALEVITGEDEDTLVVLRTNREEPFDSKLFFIPAPKDPMVSRVVSGASFREGPMIPGALHTLFGLNLAENEAAASGNTLPLSLEGVQVLVNGRASPLLYVSRKQVNFQGPQELQTSLNRTVPIQVIRKDKKSEPDAVRVVVQAANPAAFLLERRMGMGSEPALIPLATHADGRLVREDDPALPGEVIVLYLTGLGAVNPIVPSGTPAPNSPLSWVVAPVEVTVAGISAAIHFAGLAPGFVGLYQMNLQVPESVLAGLQPLAVAVSGIFSPNYDLPVGSR